MKLKSALMVVGFKFLFAVIITSLAYARLAQPEAVKWGEDERILKLFVMR